MQLKKWPYWFKWGLIVAVIISILRIAMQAMQNATATQNAWSLSMFEAPGFFIFAFLAIFFNLDYISSSSAAYQFGIQTLWFISNFIVYFGVGALISLIVRKIKSRANNT
jgi:uncharacterized membrane protein